MQNEWMHKWMVIIAVLVLLVSLLLHQIAPADELYVLVATTALGFLFGKATNGFGKRGAEEREEK